MDAQNRSIRPFDEAIEDQHHFESHHPMDLGVTQAFDAAADEASNPASNLVADDDGAAALEPRLFRTPGLSLGNGSWRTVPTYSE